MNLAVIVLPFLLCALAAYLIGSISFSIIFTKLFKHCDVRQLGSGNAGTTNVLRTAGKLPAILTLILDFLKCILAICVGLLIFNFFSPTMGGFLAGGTSLLKFMAGFFCVLGHIYPVYFGFRGGKGVLSTAAVVLMIDWRLFCIGIGVFLIMLAITRIVSLSSLVAVSSFALATLILQLAEHNPYVAGNTLFALVFAALIFYKHSANIKRLREGTESKIGGKPKES